jgi:P27 family predicted phage terminase small subunit
MARRGRKPADPGLQVLKGSSRTLPARVTALEGHPAIPDGLDAAGETECRRLIAVLGASGVLDALDGPLLARYSVAYSDWCKARKLIGDEDIITSTGLGAIKAHPAVAIARDAARTMTEVMDELRRRTKAVGSAKKDRLGEFLDKRKRG